LSRLYWGSPLKYIFSLLILISLISCNTISDNLSSEFFNIGNAYYEVGEYEKAIEYYNRALIEGSDGENSIRYNLAIAYSESNRVQEGLVHFEYLLDQDPENMKILQSIAYAYYLLEDRKKSLELYDKILGIFGYNSTALFNKALLLIDDNMDEAEEVLEKLYSVDSSVEVVLLLGRIYKENEKWDSFIEIYELALVDNQNSPDILKDLIGYYESSEQYYKFLFYMEKLLAVEDWEKLSDLYFRKAEVELVKLNDFNAGLQSLKNAVDNGFDDLVKVNALLDTEELIYIEQIESFFRSRDLIE
jgi:tetratricopeptide (TPR) repeat protein